MSSYFGCNGTVYCMTTDGSENIYIGGDFTQVNYGDGFTPIDCSGVAIYNTQTQIWTSVADLSGICMSIAVDISNNVIYALDSLMEGVSNKIYKYNSGSWSPIDIATEGTINCISFIQSLDLLCVGGHYNIIDGSETNFGLYYPSTNNFTTSTGYISAITNIKQYDNTRIIVSGYSTNPDNPYAMQLIDLNNLNSPKNIVFLQNATPWTNPASFINTVSINNEDIYFIQTNTNGAATNSNYGILPWHNTANNILNNDSSDIFIEWNNIYSSQLVNSGTITDSLFSNGKLYFCGNELNINNNTYNIFNIKINNSSSNNNNLNIFGGLVSDVSSNTNISCMVELNGFIYVGGNSIIILTINQI